MDIADATLDAIARADAASIDRLLDELESAVPRRAGAHPIDVPGATEALVFGDTHGDLATIRAIVGRFAASPAAVLVGLGDYVDRTPAATPGGSAIGALYLLATAARAPERVVLVQGNHENARRIPFHPRDLPDEVRQLWGPDPSRTDRIVRLLERGPLSAWTPSGAYLAHAGFPRGPLPTPWSRAFDAVDDDRLAEIVWAECAASRIRRGAAPAFDESALREFLAATGLSVFLRGHDPDLTGRPVYGGRCLTLHSTRVFAQYGGVLLAHLPLREPATDVGTLRIERLPVGGAGTNGASATPVRRTHDAPP